MAKFIICDCAKSNWGKTTTLREVEGIFAKSSEFTNLYRRISTSGLDVWAAYERIVDKKVFFIQTEGDLKSSFYPTEAYLNQNKVDIIICASRDTGPSRNRVDFIAQHYAFEPIFFSNFCPTKRLLRANPFINIANKFNLANTIINLALTI